MNKKSAKILKSAILECLGGPRGDPDRSNLYPAACMVKVLLDEGFKVDKDTMNCVQKDNIYDHDFLQEVQDEFKK